MNIFKKLAALSVAVAVALSFTACEAKKTARNSALEKFVTSEVYDAMLASGIISEKPSKATPVSEVVIEKVETVGEHFVAVTFNGHIDSFDSSDLLVTSLNPDWYSLNPAPIENSITSLGAEVGVNKDGKTVAVYKLDNSVNGGYLTDVTETELSFSDVERQKMIVEADNIMTWQIPDNGGWDKDLKLHKSRAKTDADKSYITKGWSVGNTPLGTIDNDGTYSEMWSLAYAYEFTEDQKYRDSFLRAVEFLKKLQYPSGGFAQVYPRRGNYSDSVTYNDNAMVSVMILLEKISANKYPFKKVVTDSERNEIKAMLDKGVDYMLKSQIVFKDGTATGWCAQHNPVTYAPVMGRAYELASVSGSESVSVARFLMNQRDNEKAVRAAENFLKWIDTVKMTNTAFDNKQTHYDSVSGTDKYFYYQEGSTLWNRFYEIDTGKGIFSDRTSKVFYNIEEIEAERREGYSWAGRFPEKILKVYNEYGYYPNKIAVKTISSKSQISGGSLKINNLAYATSG